MAKGKKRMKDEVIVALIFIGIIVFALILGWWEKHTAIGWTIIGIIVVLFGFFLYKSPRFRGWILKKGKGAGEKVVFKDTQQVEQIERIETEKHDDIDVVKVPPLSAKERAKLINAVGNKCENPNCREKFPLEVHHIKPRAEGGSNKHKNLIVLCNNCHGKFQGGIYSRALLKEWISRPQRFKSDGWPAT